MNKKQQQPLSSPSRSFAARHWQLAVAVLALSAAALSGCDRRAETTSTSSAKPASAASR